MQRFQRVLQYLTNYQLALFLEKFNTQGDTTNLLIRIENVSKQSSLDQFYRVLSSFFNGTCFYCGKSIKRKEAAHVDHFIPWSFVQADQLWYLVIACSPCNLSKSDKLASGFYLENLIERNDSFIKNEIGIKEDMKVYTPKKLQDLYKFSIDNGFTDIWVPKSIYRGFAVI